jgi:hypothetical protein
MKELTMTQIREGTVVPILLVLLSILSCAGFGTSDIAKPTKIVDFPSMVGKSLQELTTMLGSPTQRVLCYNWQLPEGELSVCYENDGKANTLMSSLSYRLNPDSEPRLGVGSIEEMMALVSINVKGKKAEEHRKGFFTYDIEMNGKSCFVDVHPASRELFFGPPEPTYVAANLHIKNPSITFYSMPNSQGNGKTYYEQQTNIDLSVGSVTMGTGDWEVCTEPNFTGKCKILDGIGRDYLENSDNFSRFGLGENIRSFRPVTIRR